MRPTVFLRRTFAASLIAGALTLPILSLPGHAVPLAPGSTLDLTNYDVLGVTAGDPNWFGTELRTVTQSANETRDGFVDGVGVVQGLYDVTAGITSTVSRTASGRLVFDIMPFASDASLAGTFNNGAQLFRMNGFAGYTIDFAWSNPKTPMHLLAPGISLSADGDEITINMLAPDIPSTTPKYERFLFAVDATDIGLTGAGEVDIVIDSFGTTTRTLSGFPVPAVIPLPASGLALLLGLAALGAARRRPTRQPQNSL